MKAIPTTYKGRLFRSRLEARWAVAFDELRIPWEYELVGWQLADGRPYLPDFTLWDGSTALEVKPSWCGEQARLYAADMAAAWRNEDPLGRWLLVAGVPQDHVLVMPQPVPGGWELVVGQLMQCRRCSGISWRADDSWGQIGPHTCRDHDSEPSEPLACPVSVAWQFDHRTAHGLQTRTPQSEDRGAASPGA